MRFTVTIDCDNDAFTDSPLSELAEILRGIARRLDAGTYAGAVRDSNGNHVGDFEVGR